MARALLMGATMTRIRTGLSFLLLASLFHLGCVDYDGAAASDDEEEAAEADATTATAEEGLAAAADPTIQYMIGGSQTGSFYLGPQADRLCYLSEIRGNYRGDGEHVWLSAASYGWYLHKDSQQYGVQVSARCTPRSRFAPAGDSQLSVPSGWFNGGGGYRTANLWNYWRSVCYLSGLQGAMNGMDNRAEMAINIPYWALDTFNIKAHAMCLDLGSGRSANQQGTYTWNPGNPDVRMMAIADGACMISKVQGSMRSTDDYVYLYPLYGYWYLSGRGNVSVDAVCYRYAN